LDATNFRPTYTVPAVAKYSARIHVKAKDTAASPAIVKKVNEEITELW
jgi:hypothetical protein